MLREPQDTLTLVVRAKDGQSLEDIQSHCQAGAYVAIGRGTAVIDTVLDLSLPVQIDSRDVRDYCPEGLNQALWNQFCQMRHNMGKPLEPDTARLHAGRLLFFRKEGFCMDDIVRKTVESQWMSFHLTADAKALEAV